MDYSVLSSSGISHSSETTNLYKKIWDFDFSMPGGWDEHNFSIFLEACNLYIYDLKHNEGQSEKWKRIISYIKERSKFDDVEITLNSVMELSKAIKTYIQIYKRDQVHMENTSFRKLVYKTQELLPYFYDYCEYLVTPSSSTSELENSSIGRQILDICESQAHLFGGPGIPTADVWNHINIIILEKTGFKVNIHDIFRKRKLAIIDKLKTIKSEEDRHITFLKMAKYYLSFFDYIQPRVIKIQNHLKYTSGEENKNKTQNNDESQKSKDIIIIQQIVYEIVKQIENNTTGVYIMDHLEIPCLEKQYENIEGTNNDGKLTKLIKQPEMKVIYNDETIQEYQTKEIGKIIEKNISEDRQIWKKTLETDIVTKLVRETEVKGNSSDNSNNKQNAVIKSCNTARKRKRILKQTTLMGNEAVSEDYSDKKIKLTKQCKILMENNSVQINKNNKKNRKIATREKTCKYKIYKTDQLDPKKWCKKECFVVLHDFVKEYQNRKKGLQEMIKPLMDVDLFIALEEPIRWYSKKCKAVDEVMKQFWS